MDHDASSRQLRTSFLSGSHHDTTGEPTTEERAKEYAAMIVDTVREGLLVLDLDLRVQSANRSFYERFQVAPENAIGRRVYELGNGQWDIPKLRELLEEILPHDHVVDGYEITHLFEHVGERTMVLNARKIDEPPLILLAIENATERKRTGRALRESESQPATATQIARLGIWEYGPAAEAMFNQMTEGLVIFDPEGHLLDMNPAALAIHGLDSAESIQRHLSTLTDTFELYDMAGNLLPTEAWPIGRVLQGETFSKYEVRVRRPDTGRSWIGSYGGTPVYGPDGELLAAIITLRDVTAQREAEEALRQLNETLEERVEERTQQVQRLAAALTIAEQEERRRIANILHDHIQQLLYGMEMSLRRLRKQYDAPPEKAERDKQRMYLNQLEETLEEALQDTRTLSVELSPPIATGEDLGTTLEWLAHHMKERHGLSAEIRLPGNFEVPTEELRTFLFQLTRELLFNVIKHAGVDEARVEGERRKGQIILHVHDHGKGFDQRVLHEHSEGRGLRTMRRRLRALGGTMDVDTAPGEGTHITLRIPSA